ncbi:MAG: bifunctional YncE family protein/alkaline phosphatase family protein [Candidatus Sumerlaeota bacterium]|nr:bifunctional YncE family protein/alkaline phosphatase family protein [Candidatus Sumerlaeota bacterium]
MPNQWKLNPAGMQTPIGDLPMNMAFSPDGKYLAITHSGYGSNDILLFSISDKGNAPAELADKAKMKLLWYGLAFSADGAKLYAAGGKDDTLHIFDVKNGHLEKPQAIDLYKSGKKLFLAGLAPSRNGKTLYAACMMGHSIAVFDLTASPATASFIPLETESYPYACLLSADGKTLYVSLWGKAQIAEVDVAAPAGTPDAARIRRLIAVQDHPNEMIFTRDGKRLFVSNANMNTVSVIDVAAGKAVETLCSALYPTAPEGSTPNSLALTPDEKHLLIANADNNNLAVFELESGKPAAARGFIPTGWYPTSVRVHPKTNRIFVASAKGMVSKANPKGPQPGIASKSTSEYIGGLFTGTLGVLDWPDASALAKYTRAAYECSPYQEGDKVTAPPAEAEKNPIPRKVGDPSPIKYCVYIIKENRTYDQIFGDVKKGKGDSSLCLFPEKVTPNHHAIIAEFVLLDNFYVESEVSADGHEWTTGAYATDFVEKQWPAEYGHSARWNVGYPSEGKFRIAEPSAGYIWDQCAKAGVSYRSYGEFINNGKSPADPGTGKDLDQEEWKGDPGKAAVKTLEGHFDPYYRGFDMKYKEVLRARRFIYELRQFEKSGDLPRFIVLRLPNDHTAGSSKGHPTPTAMVADNDQGLGMVIEALSKSRFWKEMAIFIVEDDAQNGPDHVDAHRTVAMVISPYCKRGAVDSNLYSTCSMLRTMELILGLKPMSQFDAAARPMFASFTATPDFTPYKCLPAQVNVNEMNRADAWGAKESLALNLEIEDANDDIRFNEIIWKNVRGANSVMPAPVRAAFVFPLPKDKK